MYHPVTAQRKAVSPSAMNDLPPPPAKSTGSYDPTMKSWGTISACALLITLVSIVLNSHSLYKITDRIFEPLGLDLADVMGCSKPTGSVFHGVVLYLVVCMTLKASYCK